jgi:hypothetical protein
MSASYLHEGLVALLRERPVVVLDLLRAVHSIDLTPASLVQLDAADLTALDPAERRADVVLLCLGEGGQPVYGLIVEVQLAPDPDKPFRWPAYAAVLRDRRRCPVDVLVVCVDHALAAALAAPIRLGRGPSLFQPLVIGPDAVPLVVDPAQATREPELAVLSALAHREGEAGADAAFAALAAAAGLDDRRRGMYADLVWGALNEATRQAIEARMAQSEYQYQSEFARTYFAQGEAAGEVKGRAAGEAAGEARGEAKAILAVLEARGLRVTAAQRERVLACSDLEQLEGWVRRAVTVKTTAELFASPKRPAKARR